MCVTSLYGTKTQDILCLKVGVMNDGPKTKTLNVEKDYGYSFRFFWSEFSF